MQVQLAPLGRLGPEPDDERHVTVPKGLPRVVLRAQPVLDPHDLHVFVRVHEPDARRELRGVLEHDA
eukprot:317545-Rhodomonas_salina.1